MPTSRRPSHATSWTAWTPPAVGATTPRPAANDAADATERAATERGYAQGLESGRAEGYQRGFTQGMAAGQARWDAQCEAQGRQLEALLRGVGKALAELDSVVPDGMLDTTLAAARYLAMTAFDANPEQVREVVLRVLAVDPLWGDEAFLVVHPDDAILLGDTLAAQVASAGLTVHADPTMARGDCAIVGKRGGVRANRAQRWKSMVAHLREAEPHGRK